MNKKIAFSIALLTLIACANNQPKSEEEITCQTITLQKSEKTLFVDYPASVKGYQAVDIRPQVSGTLTKICINEGANVKKGQLLFIIDQVPYKAAYEVAKANVWSAEASLASARLTMSSNQNLHKENIISEYEVQMASNNLAEATAKLALAKAEELNARNNLSYTEVRSPVDGVAGMIPYRVGTLVSSNISEPLVTVSDDSQVFAYASVSENQLLEMIEKYGSVEKAINEMSDVSLKLSNGKMFSNKGRLDAISGTIEESTGTIYIRAVFRNEGHLLRNGSCGSIVIPTSYKDCVVIPQAATYELQNKIFVFRVVDGKAVSTEIKVYPEKDGESYIVESGLQETDTIVAEGAGLIKNGTKIKPVNKKR